MSAPNVVIRLETAKSELARLALDPVWNVRATLAREHVNQALRILEGKTVEEDEDD